MHAGLGRVNKGWAGWEQQGKSRKQALGWDTQREGEVGGGCSLRGVFSFLFLHSPQPV